MDRTRAFFDRLVAWSPVFLLGGLAGLTYWLDAQVQAPPSHRDGSTRHDPDLFLQDFRAVTFDERGRPSQALAAAKAEHFPDNDTAELVDPRLALTQP
ncbi:MAG TPA: LPS export ABC transporter periplasmic protein LptC, partial [Casimicrobiaceae bacterium]|nr:LPS export ABC transporter periplasmic protein LptC [Casimicrobiaceae bacterium]